MPEKILIIDDDPVTTKLLQAGLRKSGYEVDVAHHPAHGFKMAVKTRPDLIILDVLMPVITGYELTKLLRKIKELDNVPIIVMSAKDNMKNFFDSIQAHAFVKKGDFGALTSAVKEALGGRVLDEKEAYARLSDEEKSSFEQVVLAGVDEFLMKRIKSHLESRSLSVYQALHEEDACQQILSSRPELVLVQFWEDRERFQARTVVDAVRDMADVKEIAYAVFASKGVGMDALQTMGKYNLLTYQESSDLLTQLDQLLSEKALV